MSPLKYKVGVSWHLRGAPDKGGYLTLEVPGENKERHAAKLAKRMRGLYPAGDVRISNLTKSAELRIRGHFESILSGDVVEALVAATGCVLSDVKADVVRSTERELGTLWVQYPFTAARNLAAEASEWVVWRPRSMYCPNGQCNATSALSLATFGTNSRKRRTGVGGDTAVANLAIKRADAPPL